MRRNIFYVVALALAACGGGDGGTTISLAGLSDEEAAQELGEALCDETERCPQLTLSVTDGTWSGTVESATAEEIMECRANPGADFEAIFTCIDRASLDAKIEECFNDAFNQSCITQAEVDAYVAKLNMGDEDAVLRERPPACNEVVSAFLECE